MKGKITYGASHGDDKSITGVIAGTLKKEGGQLASNVQRGLPT